MDETNHYLMLDKFLRHNLPDLKLSSIYKLIRTGSVKVNGKKTKDQAAPIDLGDKICVTYGGKTEYLKRLDESRELVPHRLPLTILYEDDTLLAIDKPAGLSMHPGKGIQIVTLIEGIMAYGLDKGFKPFLVHRLDKHTSGVLIVAKSISSARSLTAIFREHEMTKFYTTLVKGSPVNPNKRLVQYNDEVREELEYSILERFDNLTLLDVQLFTGKKHQIRRQLSSIGNPVVCDDVYGDIEFNRDFKKRTGLKRYFLHCREMRFIHPLTDKEMKFVSLLPEDLERTLSAIR